MAVLNTQTGYRAPAQHRTTSVSRQLLPAAAPSYKNPYDPGGGGGITTPQYPTVAPAPAGTPSTYTPMAVGAPGPVPGQYDLETDPILQQMKAAAARQRSDAEAAALEQRKQLAIQYGDQAYGNTLDASTGQAAAQNPFSVLANLTNQYQHLTGGPQGDIGTLGEALNSHNLFYGGERIKELAQALQDYQGQQAAAAAQEQQGLGNINLARVAALTGADQSEQGAYNDAYNRALQYALANPAPPPSQPIGGAAYGQGGQAAVDANTFTVGQHTYTPSAPGSDYYVRTTQSANSAGPAPHPSGGLFAGGTITEKPQPTTSPVTAALAARSAALNKKYGLGG